MSQDRHRSFPAEWILLFAVICVALCYGMVVNSTFDLVNARLERVESNLHLTMPQQ